MNLFCSVCVIVGGVIFLDEQAMWNCTINYKKEEKTLTAEESKRLKEMLDAYAKKSSATTDEAETVFQAPMATFRFSKAGSQSVRYLSFHHEEPFTIEVATGNDKTRRVIHGDASLLSNVKEIINKAFPKK